MSQSITRRKLLRGLAAATVLETALVQTSTSTAAETPMSNQPVITGAASLSEDGFSILSGKRVGLISNHTGRVGGEHLANLMLKALGVRLTAIFAPEHGFADAREAGAGVRGGYWGPRRILWQSAGTHLQPMPIPLSPG